MKELKFVRKDAEDHDTKYQVLCTRTSSPFYRSEIYTMFATSDGYYISCKSRIYYAESVDRDKVHFKTKNGAEFVRYDKFKQAVLYLVDLVENHKQ